MIVGRTVIAARVRARGKRTLVVDLGDWREMHRNMFFPLDCLALPVQS